MQVWLVRHAHAVDESEDRRRPLSEEGRTAAVTLARFLRRNGRLSSAAVCWHSPLARASETAGILCAEARLDALLRELDGLMPGDDPVEIADRLEEWKEGSVIIVGHEPHLGALATFLVRGKARPVQFDLKKGSVLALESTGSVHKRTGRRRWVVQWLLAPALLG